MSQPMKRLRMIIRGRVKGVGFRYRALDEAQGLGLTGWVRNLPSGEVEILAEGRENVLKMLAAWAHLGPRASRVSSVHEEWSEPTASLRALASDKEPPLSCRRGISYTSILHVRLFAILHLL